MPFLTMAQTVFTITLKLKGVGDHKVRALYVKNGKYGVDTLPAAVNDVIVWKAKTEEPQLMILDVVDTTLYLRIGKAIQPAPNLRFAVANADIKIEGDAKEIYKASIQSADKDVMSYEKLRTKDMALTAEMWDLQKEQNRKKRMEDTVGNYQITQQITAIRKKSQAMRIQFVDDNPDSFSSILVLESLALILKPDQMEEKFGKINESFAQTKTSQKLAERIASNKRTSPGKPVIAFAQKGIDGQMVDIAALKGKVILIDFWGSWCVPCRQSHPALKAIYAKFKSRGFEIVGVSNETASLGKTKEAQDASWRKAVKEDGINWLHISMDPDIRDLAKEYDIKGYPTKFLVDQDGKFIMSILGNSPEQHKMLEEKLEKILPQ